ncbi:hypothetical protein CK203_103672 [Vitis vinifera]|uniref:Uncharacterized protein n=1 Tax=Vitis vinifera TaxID=29760 RepID=A0A438DND0_VITVI|nr:hypothetical protein CK203_103672 [Vitis vinifera]
MTTHHVRDPTVIHFTIDGRHGILGAKHIAEALHIPYEPIQQHLGILLPPEHDMPSPSELIDPSQEAPPVEQTMPHEETTTSRDRDFQSRALRLPQLSHHLHTILPPLPDHLSTFCIYLL